MTDTAPPAKSQATNVYDLLEDVCATILEEPRRYNQGEWGAVRGSQEWEYLPETLHPDCGTVGCRAGWIVVKADGAMPMREEYGFAPRVNAILVPHRASQILGKLEAWTLLDNAREYERDINALFDESALTIESNDDEFLPLKGSREYAERGVAGLRAFMTKWNTYLKSLPIAPLGK